jgi:hypothetical protein
MDQYLLGSLPLPKQPANSVRSWPLSTAPSTFSPVLSQAADSIALKQQQSTKETREVIKVEDQQPSSQYIITKSGASPGWNRPPNKKTTYKEKIKSIYDSGQDQQMSDPMLNVAGSFNLMSEQKQPPFSGQPPLASRASAGPPEIVFPREPLLPSEIQGFVSGLGYAAGGLPTFATSSAPVSTAATATSATAAPPVKGVKAKPRMNKAKESSRVRFTSWFL